MSYSICVYVHEYHMQYLYVCLLAIRKQYKHQDCINALTDCEKEIFYVTGVKVF